MERAPIGLDKDRLIGDSNIHRQSDLCVPRDSMQDLDSMGAMSTPGSMHGSCAGSKHHEAYAGSRSMGSVQSPSSQSAIEAEGQQNRSRRMKVQKKYLVVESRIPRKPRPIAPRIQYFQKRPLTHKPCNCNKSYNATAPIFQLLVWGLSQQTYSPRTVGYQEHTSKRSQVGPPGQSHALDISQGKHHPWFSAESY